MNTITTHSTLSALSMISHVMPVSGSVIGSSIPSSIIPMGLGDIGGF
jgi:hypothetical protein